MGIPSYFAYILRNHNKILGNLTKLDSGKEYRRNLYLDSNSIIYDVVRRVEYTSIDKYERTVIEDICKRIDEYIRTVVPKNGSIFIAFDGVPPVAKLSQQKNRRYKNWYQNHVFNTTNRWDTTNITPGTRFMNALDKSVVEYFKQTEKHYRHKYGIDKIIVSGSGEPGEGEHKIYQYIRENPDKHIEADTVIYGLDADLIMLSLNHLSYCKNIYLYREAPHFISNIDSSLSGDQEYILDMSMFRDELYKLMVTSFEISKTRDDCIRDYIFMCFLLGNDFLPHFPAINIRHNGIDQLLQLYKMLYGKNNQCLVTRNGRICWRNLKTFISHIGDNEEELLLNIYKIREKIEKRDVVINDDSLKGETERFTNVPMKNRSIERYINPFEKNWRWRYYKSLFNHNTDNKDDDFIKGVCMNYLEALEWTYKYYTIGCQDWRSCYRYNYPPLFQDLVKYIPYFDTEMIGCNNNEPLDVNTTLAYVLPLHSLYLLDDRLRTYLQVEWVDYYRDDYDFQWAFCRYFWESHVEFPELDIGLFNKAILDFTDLPKAK
jgi:5'-3' exonuclease